MENESDERSLKAAEAAPADTSKRDGIVDRVFEKVALCCCGIGMFALVCVMHLTLRHALGRYFFAAPVSGAIELTCFGVVIGVFMLIVYAMNKGTHVAVGMFVDLMPKKVQNILLVFTSVLVVIFMFSLAYETVKYAPSISMETSTVLKIHKQPFFYVVAAGLFLTGVGAVIKMYHSISEFAGSKAAIIVIVVAVALCLVTLFVRPFGGIMRSMTALNAGIIGLIVFFVLMFLKLPVAISMGFSGFLTLGMYLGWDISFSVVSSVPFSSLFNYTWSTVPMFVLMGYLAKNTELAESFFYGVRKWIGHLPGGLLHSVVAGNGAFGACSGDSIGAAVTFSSISLPETRKYKYDDSLVLGCVAGGSIVACVLPPSLMMIIYGAATQTSIARLFIGGILPGLIIILSYFMLVAIISYLRPQKAPKSERASVKEALQATPPMLYLMLLFLIIIGGIYLGLFSPTEAGAFGSASVILIGILRKKITFKKFLASCREAATTIGMIGLILTGSLILQRLIVLTGVTTTIGKLLTASISDAMIFLLVAGLTMLILGLFIDALPFLMLIAPILQPVAVSLGIDSVHFGVFSVLVIMIGTLTPPVGIAIYTLATVNRDVPMWNIFKGVLPFVLVLVIISVIVAAVPYLSLGLIPYMIG